MSSSVAQMGVPVHEGTATRRGCVGVNSLPALPAPLNEENLQNSLKELPEGTRRATEACVKCFKERKFTPADLLSFIRSIAAQSATLTSIMRENAGQATPRRAIVAKQAHVAKPIGYHSETIRGVPGRAIVRVDMVEHQDTKFEKTEDAVDMTAKLIERRRREVRRRQLSAYPGGNGEKRSRYMSSVIRRLSQQVPLGGQVAIRDAIRDYTSHKATPEQFVACLQDIVDEYGTTVTLQYTPEHQTRAPASQGVHSNKRNSSSQSTQAARKRAKPEPAVINIDSSPSPTSSYAHSPGESEWQPHGDCFNSQVPPMENQEQQGAHCSFDGEDCNDGGAMPKPDGPVSSFELHDTPLGDFLTARAAAESVKERNVTVKVVSQVVSHTGSGDAVHPYRTKSIFAFQQLDAQGEVMLLGMYVHEFGPDAPSETAGRVLIECVDSIPIHGNERSDERQRLLTAIVHGYIEYVKDLGFTHVHFRVPPPSAENHHIFTARTMSVRLEATVRMAHWYRRLLEGAQQKGLVAKFELQSHLSKMDNFPPAILPSSDLAEEHAFSTMRSQLSRSIQGEKRDENDIKLAQKLASFKDRFCVAWLSDPSAVPPPQPRLDGTPDFATSLTSKRLTFVMACKRENLSFGSLADAKMSTMLLLARMISDQRGDSMHRSAAQSTHDKESADQDLMQQDGGMGLTPEALVEFDKTGSSSNAAHEQQDMMVTMSHVPSWATAENCQEGGQAGFDSRGGNMSVEDVHWDADIQVEVAEAGAMDAELFADSFLSM